MTKLSKLYEMNETEIYQFINKHIPIKEHEKDKYGEVFTSPLLIEKMLNLFPSNVWTNHELKWLDPSTGTGFYMIFVYTRLMKGLKSWEANEEKRSKHIIEKMLYMVEINNTNCEICKGLFGTQINLICSDFLDEIKFKTNKNMLFDCIVGNPPYQDDYGLTNNGKRINGGKSKLYERFFLKCVSLLQPNGYLSFVVPNNIFSGNGSKSYNMILENYIRFVSFNPNNSQYFPKIQQPVCYFILHKTNNNKDTTIEYADKKLFKVKLLDRPVNPIQNWTPKTEKLIRKFVSNNRNNVVYNRGKNIDSYKGDKYKIAYTPSKMLHTNNLDLAAGYGIKKAILFSMSNDLEFKMDYSGKLGAGPNTFYIPFMNASDGKKLEAFLNSKEYKILAKATKSTRQYLKISFIEYIKLTNIFKKHKTRKAKKTTRRTKKRRTGSKKTKNITHKHK